MLTLLSLAAAIAAAALPLSPPAASAPALAQALPVPEALAARGVKRFAVAWAGPAIPLWYYRPAGAPADAPVLFVFHGVGRDADRYIGEWLDLAERAGAIVAVPEFTKAGFPGAASYNHGNLFENGVATPRARWTYSALEPLFDALVAREHLTTARYNVFGHSAGAQFAHRFVLTGGAPRAERIISANAGSYAFPTATVDWPFGMGKLPPGVWDSAKAYAQPMTLMLGTADNDPNYPSLPKDPEAMRQGKHRLARGKAFYAAARRDARKHGLPFAWGCLLVPGVGHENGRMAPYAMALLQGAQAATPGADCRKMVKVPGGED